MNQAHFLDVRNQEIKDIEALAQGLKGSWVAEPSASHTAVCSLRGHGERGGGRHWDSQPY